MLATDAKSMHHSPLHRDVTSDSSSCDMQKRSNGCATEGQVEEPGEIQPSLARGSEGQLRWQRSNTSWTAPVRTSHHQSSCWLSGSVNICMLKVSGIIRMHASTTMTRLTVPLHRLIFQLNAQMATASLSKVHSGVAYASASVSSALLLPVQRTSAFPSECVPVVVTLFRPGEHAEAHSDTH